MQISLRRLALSIAALSLMALVIPSVAVAQQSSDPHSVLQPLHLASLVDFTFMTAPADLPDHTPTPAQPAPAPAKAAHNHGGVGIGIKGGPLFSSFNSAGGGYSNRTGLEGGIFFGGNRPGAVGVMGEILYAKKGTSASSGSPTDLYYLEIPILLRINVGSKSLSGVSGYVIAGPVFDVKLRARQNGLDVASNYNGLDIGVIGGAGIEITRVVIEARENWGLRDINKSASITTPIKTRSFAVLIGVRFN